MHPDKRLIFAFPGIKFEPGKIKAVATQGRRRGPEAAIDTAGAPRRLKLTAYHAGRAVCWRMVRMWRFSMSKWWTPKAGAVRPTRPGWISSWKARPSGAAATTAANRFREQPLAGHGMRRQPGGHPLHAGSRKNYSHGHPSRPGTCYSTNELPASENNKRLGTLMEPCFEAHA